MHSFAQFHESGWMQKDIFIFWFKKFVEFVNPSPEKPVLLLLDGHATHTKSLELILLARSHNVVIICFPPHCTHRMQPLDVALMGPLNTYYSEEVDKWLHHHPGRIVTDHQVAVLHGKAYLKASSMQMAVNEFRSTRIHPLDPNVFPDNLSAPSMTTERSQEAVKPMETDIQQTEEQPISVPKTQNPVLTDETAGPITEYCASTSFTVSPSQIVKLPQVDESQKCKCRGRRGKNCNLDFNSVQK